MTKPFALDRRCTCTFNRFSECVNDGWHEVDSYETEGEARQDRDTMNREIRPGGMYRARDRATGRILE